ncbi:hypothetical protein [Paraburkholderia caribensis]|uniref:hypothetical protein n=1 Tax=Paraburkholderia caribensis TaxID=75105 RepID=UPI0034D24575
MRDQYALSPPISRHRYLDGVSPLKVDPDAPLELRRAVETLARYFKKELGFDELQFEASETRESLGYVPYEAYIFYNTAHDRLLEDQVTPHRIFGACCFRWREWKDQEAGWSHDWVWMHPYFRRRGHLRRAWPLFQQRYGERFHIELPLSIEMQAFANSLR